jgi:cell division protein FtsA
VKNQGTTQILGENGEVTEEDMDDVADIARAVVLPDDRQVIHTIHGHYSIDGQERVVRPEGMVGHQLRLDMLILHGVKTLLDNSSWAVDQLAYNVGDIAFGGLCSALAVLTAEQKHSGVVVIDLGCGTTDYMAYDDGFAVCGGSLGVGGDHVTNDIQQAFSIQRKRAENLKCEHGSAVIGSAHEQAQVSLPAEVGFSQTSINVRTLQVVINARLREIFEMIKKQLDAEGILPVLGAGIVLTGGGAHMDGVVDLAREVFKAPCSIGIPRGISGIPKITDGPEYAACCGLLRYGFKVQERMQYESGSFLGGLVGRLLGRN